MKLQEYAWHDANNFGAALQGQERQVWQTQILPKMGKEAVDSMKEFDQVASQVADPTLKTLVARLGQGFKQYVMRQRQAHARSQEAPTAYQVANLAKDLVNRLLEDV